MTDRTYYVNIYSEAKGTLLHKRPADTADEARKLARELTASGRNGHFADRTYAVAIEVTEVHRVL